MSKLKFRANIKRRAQQLVQANDDRGILLFKFYRWIESNTLGATRIDDHWLNYEPDEIADWMQLMHLYDVSAEEQRDAFESISDPKYRQRGNLDPLHKDPGNSLREIYIRYVMQEKGGYATREWFKNKFPGTYLLHTGGLTLPGQNYVGPGNEIGNKITNQLDAIAAEHDLLYSIAKNEQDIHNADELFSRRIKETSMEGWEWWKGALASELISYKLFFEKRTGVWYGLNKDKDLRLTNGEAKWDYKNMHSVKYTSRSHLIDILRRKEELDKYKEDQTEADYINDYIDELVDKVDRYA